MHKSNLRSQVQRFCSLLVVACCVIPALRSRAAESEQDLLRVLQSDSSGDQKAIACKKLAIYGSSQAVPALAKLLGNEQLSSWARIALEAIPGPAADEALRNALPTLSGRVLVGTINSIGVRRDPQAVAVLTPLLKNTDAQVASAASIALGRIGGDAATKLLTQLVSNGPETVRTAAAEGCIRCAEKLMAQGKTSDAAKIYDTVRKAQIPKQQLLDATRGAILARKAKGIPLLVEQLKSPDKAFFAIALSTARELPGTEATKAIAKELRQANPERQPMILMALADRSDPQAMPAIVEAARTGSPKLRLTAVALLEKQGNVSSVPLLLECATGTDADLAQASKASLVRLYGTEVDQAIIQRLPQSEGRTRQALIEVANRRGINSAMPEFLKSAADKDEGVCAASLQAIGALGGAQEIPELVRLAQTAGAKNQPQVEQALLAICGRTGSGCAPGVQPLLRDASGPVRIMAAHALAAAGGADALAALKEATRDQDTSVQDEAVRTLSSWPNTWPEDSGIAPALLAVAKEDANPTHKVLALRGYLQFLQGDKQLTEAEKVQMAREALPLMQRAEEKRSTVALVRKLSSGPSLQLLSTLAADPNASDEACAAILDLAGKERKGISREERQQALQTVAEKSKDEGTKHKAEEALKSIQ